MIQRVESTEYVLSCYFCKDIWTRFILPLIIRYPGCSDLAYDAAHRWNTLCYSEYSYVLCSSMKKVRLWWANLPECITIMHLIFRRQDSGNNKHIWLNRNFFLKKVSSEYKPLTRDRRRRPTFNCQKLKWWSLTN